MSLGASRGSNMSDRAYAKVQAQQKPLIRFSPKSSPLQRTCACGGSPSIDGLCTECRDQRLTLQSSRRDFEAPSVSAAAQDNSPAQENITSSSAVVDRASHFGHDFSRIPVYSSQLPVLQTKLKVNQPGDIYEQEADQVAEQVMRMTNGEFSVPDEVNEAKDSLMCKQASEPGAHTATEPPQVPPIVQAVLNSGGGQPLDATTRVFMEPRFGYDFSKVRVHSDERAAESAQAVSALAYTVGRDVVFGLGQYAPKTMEGKRLIAHELAHVVQQASAVGTFDRELRFSAPVVRRQSDPAEEKRVAELKANYEATLKRRDWKKAALYLNKFNETDILSRLSKLSQAELVAMRYGALKGMPGSSKRLTDYIDKQNPQAAKKNFKADFPQLASVGPYDFVHDVIMDASASERAAILADQASLKKLSTTVPIYDFAKYMELLGRQAPTATELIANSVVKSALDTAWKASNVPAGLGKRHEEGGYILMDLATGQLSILKASPGKTGELVAMMLPNITPPRGKIVVAHFHTHPNPEEGMAQECSSDEPEKFEADGVPGLIRSAKGTFHCGPKRRLHLSGWGGLPGPSGGEAP